MLFLYEGLYVTDVICLKYICFSANTQFSNLYGPIQLNPAATSYCGIRENVVLRTLPGYDGSGILDTYISNPDKILSARSFTPGI